MKKPLAQRRAARHGDALSNDDDPAGHALSLPHQSRPSQAGASIGGDGMQPVMPVGRGTRLDVEQRLAQTHGDLSARNIPRAVVT